MSVQEINRLCVELFPSLLDFAPASSLDALPNSVFKGLKLFPGDGNDIDRACKRLLDPLKKLGTYRVTLARIRNFHFRNLSREPLADVCTAALVLGRDEKLAQTKIHYSAFHSDELAKMFSRSVRDILDCVEDSESVLPPSPGNRLYLGTPFRLQKSAVVETVRRLKASLEEARGKANSVNGIIKFHNLFTAYTAFLFAWSTGHRRSGLPVIPYYAWDEYSGFAICRDKDTQDYYHTRLLWLAPDCREQLEAYRAHVNALGIWVQPNNLDKEQEFFFLKSQNQAEAKQSTFYRILKGHGYDYPGHPQRHFLKSELQFMGCAPVAIELFLGHWNLGQEGWVKTSALHPMDFRTELQRYIPGLMRSLELSPMKGLSRKPPKIKFSPEFKERKKTVSVKLPDQQPGRLWFDVRSKKKAGAKTFSKDEEDALALVYKPEFNSLVQPVD
jgi:hypothetical protein